MYFEIIKSTWHHQMYLLNAKSAIHHLILSKDSSSMENMPATREKVIVGNNKKYTAYTRIQKK
jgi:hypothetical protein